MNPHERRLRDNAYEAKMAAEERAQRDAAEAWQKEQLDPMLRLIRQHADLRQRIEALDVEVAMLRHLADQRGERG